MNIFFGASWKTTLAAYTLAILFVANQLAETGSVMPHTIAGWISYAAAFVVAVMGRMAKDHDVSNSPVPAAAGSGWSGRGGAPNRGTRVRARNPPLR